MGAIRLFFLGAFMSILTLVMGIPSLLVSFILSPSARLREDVAHMVAKIWSNIFFFLSGSKVEIAGLENYNKKNAYIITMNHQSAFDIFLLFKVLPGQYRWISKDTYFKIPVFGWVMKTAGYVSLNRENKRSAYSSIQKAGDRLYGGRSIAIFPEGTRSLTGEMKRFKPGIMHIAEAYKDIQILPIVWHGTVNIMRKGRFSIQSTNVKVRILPPLHLKDLEGESRIEKLRSLENLMTNEHKLIS